MRILAFDTATRATAVALDGLDSSSTNIASDHGVGNARRSIAIT